jgi:hypothetical protein
MIYSGPVNYRREGEEGEEGTLAVAFLSSTVTALASTHYNSDDML